jgi:peptidoglycan hydrolase-like protein with peptidoglycan-binding domain
MGEHRGRRLAAGVVVVSLAAGGSWWVGQHRSAGSPLAGRQVPTATARIVRTDLATTVQIDGALGYSGTTAVLSQRAGVVTALPVAGQVVTRGERLYEVDGRPVPLFYGARPQWRPLAAGVTHGPDIAQLNANLAALGYGGPAGDLFTGATAMAVQRWQAALGIAQTGAVEVGDVAYASGALRVATVTANLGAPIQPGIPVLAGTSTALVVQARVPVSQEGLVNPGDAVSVTMPDGHTLQPGAVSAVSPVAVNPNANNGPAEPTVAVTIRLDHAAGAGNLDQAPVTVNVTSARATGVLAVPVNALMALAGGGYAVQVTDAAGRHLVAVATGLFAGSLVQVTGTGVDAGTTVVVPAQ